jgi:hypothetical protein
LKNEGNESNGITKNKELITKSLELAIEIFPELIKKNNIKPMFTTLFYTNPYLSANK